MYRHSAELSRAMQGRAGRPAVYYPKPKWENIKYSLCAALIKLPMSARCRHSFLPKAKRLYVYSTIQF